jgi:hypothetical protein
MQRRMATATARWRQYARVYLRGLRKATTTMSVNIQEGIKLATASCDTIGGRGGNNRRDVDTMEPCESDVRALGLFPWARAHTTCLFQLLVLSLQCKQRSLSVRNPLSRSQRRYLLSRDCEKVDVMRGHAFVLPSTGAGSNAPLRRHQQSWDSCSSQDPMTELAAKCLVTRSVKIKSRPLARCAVLSSVYRGLFFSNVSACGSRHCNTCIPIEQGCPCRRDACPSSPTGPATSLHSRGCSLDTSWVQSGRDTSVG